MRKSFSYKVNGDEFHSEQEILTALDILRQARSKGSIPNKPDEYVLDGEKGKYKGNDPVNLSEDNVFIAIPDRPTPVA